MEPRGPAPNEQQDDTEQGSAEAWREVGRQFDALGKSLAEAFRLSWNNREARRYVMSGLESMAAEINHVLSHSGELPESQRLRSQVEKVAQTARAAAEDAMREGRPRLLMTLRQLNGELKRLIDQLEAQEARQREKPEEDDTT